MTSRLLAFGAVLMSGISLGVLTTSMLSAQFRTVRTRQLLKADLAGCVGKELTVTVNEFEPGTSGPHYHPGDSFTYILAGSEVYQIEGRPRVIVKAGDMLHEAPMQVHTLDNAAPVKLLVIRVQDKGATETVRVSAKP